MMFHGVETHPVNKDFNFGTSSPGCWSDNIMIYNPSLGFLQDKVPGTSKIKPSCLPSILSSCEESSFCWEYRLIISEQSPSLLVFSTVYLGTLNALS